MPRVYVLDNVIMKLNEADVSEQSSSLTKKVIIIDAKTKQVLDKKPRITFGRQLEFFLVSNENDPRNVAEGSIPGFAIGDFSTDRKIDIFVKYQVSCPSGHEKDVAEALFDIDSATPGIVFEGKLLNWLKSYANQEIRFSDFTTDYSRQLLDLQKHAITEAEVIGLRLRLRLSLELDESNKLKPFPVDLGDFPVLLNDFEEEINFNCRANLSIAENGKVNAILSYGRLGELKNILQAEIQSYLRKHVSLYSLCYDFEEYIRRRLVANLDKTLASHGRRIEGFFPSPDLTSQLRMPEPDPIQCDVEHDIQGYGGVIIKNVIEVEPQPQASDNHLETGVLKYRKARISDIEKWFREKLEKTIHRYLFDFRYVDILLKYSPKSIKDKLDEEAEKIGYSVRLISTVPDLKPLKLRTEGFRVELSETFPTKQNSVKIKLGIDVRGKIEDLSSIKDILNDPRNDVHNLIEKEIVDSIKTILHRVEPANFYAQEGLIAYIDDYSSEEAIKDKITRSIELSLNEKFGASSQVALQALNTELLDLIAKLTRGADHDFEILLSPSRDPGEKILFKGLFQINGVAKDQWDTFASRRPDVENVKKSIQDCIRQWFSTLSSDTLNYQSTKGLRELLKNANSLAVPKIMQKYGLLVSIEGLEAPDTKLRAAQRELQLTNEMKILQEAQEQIENDSQFREIEKSISLKEITHISQELESVRELLRTLSILPGGDERKNKMIQRESELKLQLSELIENNRKRATSITAQQMKKSIQPSTEESDFDELVRDSRALLPEESSKLNSESSEELTSSDDKVDATVIDVESLGGGGGGGGGGGVTHELFKSTQAC